MISGYLGVSIYLAGVRQAWVQSPNRLISEARTSQVKTESTESSAGKKMALSFFFVWSLKANLDLPTTLSVVKLPDSFLFPTHLIADSLSSTAFLQQLSFKEFTKPKLKNVPQFHNNLWRCDKWGAPSKPLNQRSNLYQSCIECVLLRTRTRFFLVAFAVQVLALSN